MKAYKHFNNILQKNLWSVFSLALWVGCASPSPQTSIDEMNAESEKNLLLLNYSLKSDHPIGRDSPCKLRIHRDDRDETLEMVLRPQDHAAMVSVPEPGTFEFQSLYCGLSRSWKMPKNRDGNHFEVQPGKITYLGMLSFQLQKEATELSVAYNYTQDYKTFLETYPRLPEPSKARLVSGYTGKPITAAMVAVPKSEVFPSIRLVASREAQDKMNDSPDMTLCIQKEKHSNPLFFGKLSYEVKYADNQLKELKTVKQDHAYSDAFLKCISQSLNSFRSGIADTLVYKIDF